MLLREFVSFPDSPGVGVAGWMDGDEEETNWCL